MYLKVSLQQQNESQKEISLNNLLPSQSKFYLNCGIILHYIHFKDIWRVLMQSYNKLYIIKNIML